MLIHQLTWRQKTGQMTPRQDQVGSSGPGDACVVIYSQSNALDQRAAVDYGNDVPEKMFCEFLLPHACLPAWVQRTGLGLENWVRARLGRPLCQHHLISPSRAYAQGRAGTLMEATWDLYPSVHSCSCLVCSYVEATRVSARALGFLLPLR